MPLHPTRPKTSGLCPTCQSKLRLRLANSAYAVNDGPRTAKLPGNLNARDLGVDLARIVVAPQVQQQRAERKSSIELMGIEFGCLSKGQLRGLRMPGQALGATKQGVRLRVLGTLLDGARQRRKRSARVLAANRGFAECDLRVDIVAMLPRQPLGGCKHRLTTGSAQPKQERSERWHLSRIQRGAGASLGPRRFERGGELLLDGLSGILLLHQKRSSGPKQPFLGRSSGKLSKLRSAPTPSF